jgi:hypothetical protein
MFKRKPKPTAAQIAADIRGKIEELDTLLERAEKEGLKVRVLLPENDPYYHTICNAKKIGVQISQTKHY